MTTSRPPVAATPVVRAGASNAFLLPGPTLAAAQSNAANWGIFGFSANPAVTHQLLKQQQELIAQSGIAPHLVGYDELSERLALRWGQRPGARPDEIVFRHEYLEYRPDGSVGIAVTPSTWRGYLAARHVAAYIRDQGSLIPALDAASRILGHDGSQIVAPWVMPLANGVAVNFMAIVPPEPNMVFDPSLHGKTHGHGFRVVFPMRPAHLGDWPLAFGVFGGSATTNDIDRAQPSDDTTLHEFNRISGLLDPQKTGAYEYLGVAEQLQLTERLLSMGIWLPSKTLTRQRLAEIGKIGDTNPLGNPMVSLLVQADQQVSILVAATIEATYDELTTSLKVAERGFGKETSNLLEVEATFDGMLAALTAPIPGAAGYTPYPMPPWVVGEIHLFAYHCGFLSELQKATSTTEAMNEAWQGLLTRRRDLADALTLQLHPARVFQASPSARNFYPQLGLGTSQGL